MLQFLKNQFHFLQSISASIVYGFPAKKLKIIAVTGTDGKTTTSTLIYHMLKDAGKTAALISTVAAYMNDEEIDTGFHVTTPSSFALQKLLSTIASRQIEYVVMEVTSHSIDQHRIWGITPIVSAITNVTHEHLDYHKTYDEYLRTKASLMKHSGMNFLNKDAKQSYPHLVSYAKKLGISFNDVSVHSLPETILSASKKRFTDETYNWENAALAYSICSYVGVSNESMVQTIQSFSGVPGRMEYIRYEGKPTVIIDFAHTPNALERALITVRQKMKNQGGKGKLISVFGCAGLRDHTKRPEMGEIASRIADAVVFTAEDPRTEDVWTIISHMKSGVRYPSKVMSIASRQEAIRFALEKLAKRGDTVIITGKGHEKSMCYGHTELPWSDQDAVMNVFHELAADKA